MNLDEIKAWPWFCPDGKPDPKWRLFTAPTWNNAGDAAWDAAEDEARKAKEGTTRNAARNAAWKAGRKVGKSTTWNAAWDEAWDIASDATQRHSRGTAWASAWDIALSHAIETVTPDDIDPAHVAHVRARVDVWRKGYALLCDMDGVLYVYAAEGVTR